ncbi:MAG: UDP-N-acetylmuramoyl-tripeptide--D-alanyl-D-alanine ligase, partial [Candidatus Saccharimonadales bacterium]
MLQGSEYRIKEYLTWLHRTDDFRIVMKRRPLIWTNKIKILAACQVLTIILTIMISITFFMSFGWIILLLLPWLLAYVIIIPLLIGDIFVQKPKEKWIISSAKQKLSQHSAKKIAIAGSYGKTTTKEVLKTILSEGYKVAATPGNMNTLIGTSRFIESLDGDEEIIIFELGESNVGDIKQLCDLVRPDMGIITGINQAHLASFKTIENTVATIFELQDFLGKKPLYKNGDDELVMGRVDEHDPLLFTVRGIDDWKVTDSSTSLHGTEFTIQKNEKIVWAKTKLIGEHMLGVLALSVAVADRFGLNTSQIANGLKNVKPFEHRMQPRRLHDAWIIDDTYNGNIQGVEAGLKLLKNVDAKRRVYVTPGLVEQGSETKAIHIKIGKLIANSADVAVLMDNSVTDYISEGLR